MEVFTQQQAARPETQDVVVPSGVRKSGADEMTPRTTPTAKVLDRDGLDALFDALRTRGYALVGPCVRDRAVVYDPIDSTGDLPIGLTDEQEAGRYRIKRRGDGALFGYAVGPHSWKKYLFPPVQRLFSVTLDGKSLDFSREPDSTRKLAFIGVRPCELAAIAVQDKVFIAGPYVDEGYRRQRENIFLLAVNCTEPGGTCFCASMKTGPRIDAGFDLALTELLGPDRHEFLVTVGSPCGRGVLDSVPGRDADEEDRQHEDAVLAESAGRMGRSLDAHGIKRLLDRGIEHSHWDRVAARCLACANCTMVCPTCFCSTVEDTSDLSGRHAERRRKWDSCFNGDFSYIHGGIVRASIRSRYRQWMMHKLSTWHDQFGTSGCIGCGRCVTWCPAAIDITQEAAELRESEVQTAVDHPGAEP